MLTPRPTHPPDNMATPEQQPKPAEGASRESKAKAIIEDVSKARDNW